MLINVTFVSSKTALMFGNYSVTTKMKHIVY